MKTKKIHKILAAICFLLLLACFLFACKGSEPPAVEKPTLALRYALNEDGASYTVTGFTLENRTGADTEEFHLVIPDTHEGKPVTAIAEGAFERTGEDVVRITAITLPTSLSEIGTAAFANREELKDVYITDLAAWCRIDFRTGDGFNTESSPFYYAEDLYLNGSLLTELTIPNGIDTVNSLAFYGCDSLQSVVVPFGVTELSPWCFTDCKNLTHAVLQEVSVIGEYAFSGCEKLASIELGENLTVIDECAFADCGFSSFRIPDSVTAIGEHAFMRFAGDYIIIGTGLTEVAENAFPADYENDCPYFYRGTQIEWETKVTGSYPNGIKFFAPFTAPLEHPERYWHYDDDSNPVLWGGDLAPDGGDGTAYLSFTLLDDGSYMVSRGGPDATVEHLTHLIIPATHLGRPITAVGDFQFLPAVEEITLPEGVTLLCDSAFHGCTALKKVNLPNTLTEIGAHAFAGCTGLAEIRLPASVKKLGMGAFYSCSSLKALHVTDLAAYLSMENGGNASYADAFFAYIETFYVNGTPLTELTVPTSVTRIGDYAFEGYKKLTKISFAQGNACKHIGTNAFLGCENLTSVSFADSIEFIGSSAFGGCNRLTGFTLPASLSFLGSGNYPTDEFGNMITTFMTKYNDGLYLGSKTNPYLACMYFVEGKPLHPDMKIMVTDSGKWADNDYRGYQGIYYRGGYYVGDAANPYKVLMATTGKFTVLHPDVKTVSCSINTFGYEINLYTNGAAFSADTLKLFALTNIMVEDLSAKPVTPLVYELNANGDGYTVKYAADGTPPSEVIVPAYHNGLPVTAIGPHAFGGNPYLTRVILPDTVTYIGVSAFDACRELTEVHLGAAVFFLGESAFARCSSLTYIELPDSLAIIDSFAFDECEQLSRVRMSKGIMKIGAYAFRDTHKNLGLYSGPAWAVGSAGSEHPNIQDGVITIAEGAFLAEKGFDKAVRITLPNSLKFIGYDAFRDCKQLLYNEYEGGKYLGSYNNPYLVFVGPVDKNVTSFTLHKDTKILCYRAFYECTALSSVTLPEGLVSIGEEAFSGCTLLKSLTIPSTVEMIEDMAFFKCSSLTSLTMSKVTVLGDKTFWWCTSLPTVTFRGTTAEWNAIFKDGTWDGNNILDTITCTNGTVTLD